jgi:hypothetical protein
MAQMDKAHAKLLPEAGDRYALSLADHPLGSSLREIELMQ